MTSDQCSAAHTFPVPLINKLVLILFPPKILIFTLNLISFRDYFLLQENVTSLKSAKTHQIKSKNFNFRREKDKRQYQLTPFV